MHNIYNNTYSFADEWKTNFNDFETRDKLYEYMVIFFNLFNTPITFMRLMNYIFKFSIGKFLIV